MAPSPGFSVRIRRLIGLQLKLRRSVGHGCHLVAASSGHPLHELGVSLRLEPGVVVHDAAVHDVRRKQNRGLPDLDLLIHGKHRQENEANDVVGTVAKERPPTQINGFLRDPATRTNDEEDVEHRGAYDGAETNIVLRDSGTDERREELWGRAARRHERRPCDIRLDLPLFYHDLQRAGEVDVADSVQAEQHVANADEVDNDANLSNGRRILVGL
mmetsp:Transcript_46540/g.120442  ORF Transcript_46540/g.120442 Transcript_46540/m.120442 type:complete len:215 (-) Transcript_46540:289-933(-)